MFKAKQFQDRAWSLVPTVTLSLHDSFSLSQRCVQRREQGSGYQKSKG